MLPRGDVSAARLCGSALFTGIFISLCGSPTITYLVLIGAFLPHFERVGADKRLLGLSAAFAMGVGTAWPWNSKMLLLSQIAGTDGAGMYARIAPLQVVCAGLCVICLVFVCRKDKIRLWIEKEQSGIGRGRMWFYMGIFLGSAAVLMLLQEHAVPLLAVGCAVLIGLMVRRRADCRTCLLRIGRRSILLALNMAAIGVFNHVLEGSGMLAALTGAVAALLPESLIAWLPSLFAMLSCVVLILLPYQSLYSLLPVFIALAAAHGIGAEDVILPFVISLPSTVLPSVPSTFVIDEMLEQPTRTHFRYAWAPVSAVHVVLITIGALLFF